MVSTSRGKMCQYFLADQIYIKWGYPYLNRATLLHLGQTEIHFVWEFVNMQSSQSYPLNLEIKPRLSATNVHINARDKTVCTNCSQ